jgi:hypothetical protein
MPARKQKSAEGAGSSVAELLAKLDHPHKEGIELLRSVLLAVDKRIREEVKWNAPSFMLADHFATFRLHPPKNIQLILHTGAKAKSGAKVFKIDDPDGLLTWPASDRAVLTFASTAEAKASKAAVQRIVTQWVAQL